MFRESNQACEQKSVQGEESIADEMQNIITNKVEPSPRFDAYSNCIDDQSYCHCVDDDQKSQAAYFDIGEDSNQGTDSISEDDYYQSSYTNPEECDGWGRPTDFF
ncbi:hypothetical protein ACOME3_003307 [Neoechinorhynchus agilis]